MAEVQIPDPRTKPAWITGKAARVASVASVESEAGTGGPPFFAEDERGGPWKPRILGKPWPWRFREIRIFGWKWDMVRLVQHGTTLNALKM